MSFVAKDVRVLDGESVLENASVLVENGIISKIGTDLVDAAGLPVYWKPGHTCSRRRVDYIELMHEGGRAIEQSGIMQTKEAVQAAVVKPKWEYAIDSIKHTALEEAEAREGTVKRIGNIRGLRLIMADELAERLKSHARSFDSLLSLIPAKLYYGEDVSDQWKRKKQTPEQKRAAKMAKLDPDNWKSAKDIVDERAAAAAMKRKRDDEEDEPDENSNLLEGGQVEPPKAVQDAQAPKPKKQKTDGKDVEGTTKPDGVDESQEDKRRRKAEERAAKRQRKKERKDKAKQKLERQKAKKKEAQQPHDPQKEALKKEVKKELNLQIPVDLQVSTQRKSSPDAESPSTASSEEEPEEVFSPQHESGTSSTSSIQPASIDETVKNVHSSSLPPASAQAINNHDDDTTTKTPRERLQEALSQFRAERKADGGDGRPPKNRQELLEQRRRKEEAKKAAKKEQKRREKEEEARRQDEEIARHFSPGGSGSLLASPRSPMIGDNGGSSPNSNSANNFTFGRITFEDGTHLEPSSTAVVEEHKKKGIRDTATELKLAEAKKARLAGLDEQKRLEIEQKDMWLNAKRRAHGEHVRDNTSLLKKALKRQQGQKKKSEREWNDRLEGVKKAQDAKQKKRVENLAKRKEEKGSKKTKVKRPGFEGSFKGRTGGKRKS
ncbi:hypothetical protein AYO20_05822 [Fonsecaea nubica]|uniref:Ribosomal RNA-processing protein 14/surfeit locus protein 6 C-terminal domain-containing protein n=1 Tax=Fonsecaea nubica TaxID=856822 RepID=A0A178D057_9EURO|nr:hypothetical protein AYO20_05822 [Fonsecaea nubica]OAL34862.1 hypothetical protein AYO20_05822 [Fonsecaea nubica]